MKLSPLAPSAVALILSGCVTQGFVSRQVDPIACRVDVLERKSASFDDRAVSIENRLATLESQVSQAQLANKAMLDEATAKAADSAQRAEASATSAAQAAERAEKMFELGQKK
ncbi:hypothetical protein [Geomonas subterranea]|uniref:Lipoprotein n=1 Tax=Geomonas subterranea TaxID=2847989 RepID=A0ABX8LHJ3_9BACT|nr:MULTISPECIES: hypothetical protein [Geomonas]QXE90806.1 hypothetical protein KP001_20870 [Geomonas subterranea]QXM11112.1 hypothetical protein KP002_08410 [Geomonas subterranea]